MAYTVVAFHAHPDDEVLLTGGTLARSASEGHHVVLVTATAGEAGLTSTANATAHDLSDRPPPSFVPPPPLALTKCDPSAPTTPEWAGRPGRDNRAFVRADVDGAAARLAEILASVSADVLIIYDPAGGYGHPDHVQVHRVGLRAAKLAATPVVLEATIDRTAMLRLLPGLLRLGLRSTPAEWQPARLEAAYTDPARITHQIDVRRHIPAKRAAMAAHVSQRGAHEGRRSRCS